MIFYTSDLHIGHKNAIRFDSRPFADVEEMEREIIRRWNNKVSLSDDVYILGDVFYNCKKDKSEFLKSLNGRLHLVVGNHDFDLLKDAEAMSCFVSAEQIEQIVDNGRQVIMCHFPIISWNKKHRGTYHLYGHVHKKIDEDTLFMIKQERAFNAGCMINNYEPCSLNEIIKNNGVFNNSALNGE